MTGDRDLNELNIPHHDRGRQAHILRIVNLAESHVEEIASALEAYHTHTRSRLLIIHSSLSPLNSKVSYEFFCEPVSTSSLQSFENLFCFLVCGAPTG